MKFFKCLSKTITNKPSDDGIFTFASMRYVFEDTTNPKYPKVEIWSDGSVYIFDSEDKACEADDEMIQHYCSMSDKELVTRYSTSF